MKKYSTICEGKQRLEIQENTNSYIDKADLEKYLEVAGKFIGEDATWVVQWLIDHNDYVTKLGTKGSENALASFYDRGVPTEPEYKELYSHIGKCIKAGRTLEIPVFLTKDQFKDIINKKASPDMILLDLNTEKGRSECYKKYSPLIHKMCRQYIGKSNLSYEELLSAASEIFVYAMNTYGKRNKTKVDDEAIMGTTFGQYAAYLIRTGIIEEIRHYSRVVRIPVSQQNKEKEETGRITKNNTISGDKNTAPNEFNGEQSLFDVISDDTADSSMTDMDKEDLKKIWQEIYDTLEKHFDQKTMDIWYSVNGLKDHEEMKNKDLAKKYGVVISNINYYLWKVNNFIQNNEELMGLFTDAYELMQECLHDEDMIHQYDDVVRVDWNRG